MSDLSLLAIDSSRKFTQFFKPANNRKIQHLVFHHIAAQDSNEAIALLVNHEVSSHFLIDEAGKIFLLVDEQDIAFHAGVSFWNGFYNLNETSIGIEFLNPQPFAKKFTELQLLYGLDLARYLITKYNIAKHDIVGHSDIAFDSKTGFLDRKQDPSHFFDWQFFAKNAVGIKTSFQSRSSSMVNEFTSQVLTNSLANLQELQTVLFAPKDNHQAIFSIKMQLKNFGYLVQNFTAEFDEEMRYLVRVFNRRFFSKAFEYDSDLWYQGSQLALESISKTLQS